MMLSAVGLPLMTAPKRLFQNGNSAKFVFYFAPVFKQLMRKQAGFAGGFSWFFFCRQKKNENRLMDSGLRQLLRALLYLLHPCSRRRNDALFGSKTA